GRGLGLFALLLLALALDLLGFAFDGLIRLSDVAVGRIVLRDARRRHFLVFLQMLHGHLETRFGVVLCDLLGVEIQDAEIEIRVGVVGIAAQRGLVLLHRLVVLL